MTASFQSIAHGGNDVANSVGPFSAILAANEGSLTDNVDIPMWVFAIAGTQIETSEPRTVDKYLN